MSKHIINIPKDAAIEKLMRQVEKGKKLIEESGKIIESTQNSYKQKVTSENFLFEVNQWIDLTIEVLKETFLSYSYVENFRDHNTDARVGQNYEWFYDINRSIGNEVIPKIGYLEVLIKNLESNEFTFKSKSIDFPKEKPVPQKEIKETPAIFNLEKLTLPQLFNLLTVPQWLKIIGGVFTLMTISFGIGFSIQQWKLEKENRELYLKIERIENLSKDINPKSDTLFSNKNKLSDSLKIKHN